MLEEAYERDQDEYFAIQSMIDNFSKDIADAQAIAKVI